MFGRELLNLGFNFSVFCFECFEFGFCIDSAFQYPVAFERGLEIIDVVGNFERLCLNIFRLIFIDEDLSLINPAGDLSNVAVVFGRILNLELFKSILGLPDTVPGGLHVLSECRRDRDDERECQTGHEYTAD